jgi:hypothetical protein
VADLYIPPGSPNFVIQALYFAGEFRNRFEEANVDVYLRSMLLRIAKKSFGV